jgi:hypothetical protein
MRTSFRYGFEGYGLAFTVGSFSRNPTCLDVHGWFGERSAWRNTISSEFERQSQSMSGASWGMFATDAWKTSEFTDTTDMIVPGRQAIPLLILKQQSPSSVFEKQGMNDDTTRLGNYNVPEKTSPVPPRFRSDQGVSNPIPAIHCGSGSELHGPSTPTTTSGTFRNSTKQGNGKRCIAICFQATMIL